jgi:phospholipid/cholesterol/gamma-HCH transport system substrate-binding protein
MASTKTTLIVGLFVAVGFVIAIMGIVWLGMSNYFEKGYHYVAYFDESVQGLDKDSPVKYRGVTIGRVERIQVAPDTNLIETRLKIENKIEPVDNIVAQLKSVGITGIMFIELERKNPDDPDLSPVIDFAPPYTVIKTAPSEIKALLQGLDAVFSQIKALDVTGISLRLKTTIDILNQTARTARIDELSSDISEALQKIGKTADSVNAFVLDTKETGRSIHTLVLDSRKTVKRINGTVGSIDDAIRDNKNQLNSSLVKLNQMLQGATALVQKGSGLVDNTDTTVSTLEHHLLVTLYNIESAAENLNHLINVLANQPSQLIFGQPPLPRTIETSDREKP